MLHNFLFDICGLQGGFTLEKREQQCNDYIRRTVGHDKIVLSSGFDSAVCASLLHKALLRGDESSRFTAIGPNLRVVEFRLHGRVLEPLEDEVRALGRELSPPVELLKPVSWSRFVNSNHLRRRTVLGS
ncbi:hypothetical protein OUZ56_002699 [Daphnia magna]|uniref:GMP synthase n=1 Tax=Daphnia magna TaxID=35525 RepID=A0ABR0A6I4_9CRUS|nr:hypothetical protein OUZ56_002699 [Daphnia magna]